MTIGELAQAGVLEFGDGYRTRKDELDETGFRILRAADVRDGYANLDGDDFVSMERAPKIGTKAAREGDVVLTTKGTVGRVATVPALGEAVVYSPQLCYFRVRATDVLDARFLRYWLRSPQFQQQSSYLQGNTDMAPYISLRDLASTRMVLPTVDEQRRTGELLGALDDKIEANRKLAATADELCAAIVRESQDSNRAERLGDVAEIVMGSSPPGKTMNEDGEGVPFYQGVRDFGLRFPTRRVWTTAPTRTAHGGDILVSVRAPVGTVNYAPEPLCIGRGLAAVRSRTNQQSTLFHLLRSVRRAWAEYDSGGTVFGSINRDQLHNIEIPAIRSDAVARCEAEVHSVEQRLASALRENESLAVLRDSVLPKLMSGQLRVAEAMEVVAL